MTEFTPNQKNTAIAWLFLLLPLGWIFGLHPNDAARTICGIILILLLIPKTREFFKKPLALSNFQKNLLLIFIVLYPLVISVQHLLRMYLGGEGINVAYFTNVLNNFPQNKSLLLTLNKDVPYNHLLHHFSPIFYLPAALTLLGIPGYMSFVIFELIIISSVIIIFQKILSHLGYSSTIKYIFIVLLLCNYSIRHSFNWSIEDEFFALPFIMVAYYYFLKKKPWLILLSLLISCTVKESIFLFSSAFCLMIVLMNFRDKTEFKKYNTLFISLGIMSLVCFALYIFGQPFFLGKTYDHLSKAGSVNSLFDFNTIKEKFLYLVFLLLPFLFFPLFYKKGWILNIPVLPFLFLSMVSSIPNLYNTMDYYSVIPSTIFAITTVINLKEFNIKFTNEVSRGLAIILICIAFFLSGWKPAKIIYSAFDEKFVTEKNFERLNHSYVVASSESLVPLLIGFKEVKTFEKENLKNMTFDYLVIREKEKEQLPDDYNSFLKKDENLSTNELIVFHK
ncbi:MAG: DUF2079 domain-containing protein [Bacteroidetes bacterium]|nr:DUF2079 domain-containing protein [Bacteroidota bacterium]